MSKSIAAILVVPAAIALAGALAPEAQSGEAPQPRAVVSAQPVRALMDLARGRRWELEWGAVSVYDAASDELLRRVQLPGATFAAARDSCPPDIVLSRNGALVVSSNAQPRFWRISPERFEVEVYDITANAEDDKDFGFIGLGWIDGENILQAASSATHTAWRIDLRAGAAVKLAATPARDERCAGTPEAGMRFAPR
jgi:hypothetical protein